MSHKRILTFRIGQLGDTLVTVPALRQIRKTYPDAKIHYLHDQHIQKPYVLSRDVLEDAGLVDSFVAYPVGYTLLEKLWALLKLIVVASELRKQSYDLVIRLEPERRTAKQLKRDDTFFKILRIPNSISVAGFREPELRPPFEENQEHESDFYLRALSECGIGDFEEGTGDPSLGLTEEDQAEWRRVLEDDLDKNLRWIAVGVGSKMKAKQWSLSSFQNVLRSLIETHKIVPVFLGGPEDAEASDAMIEELGAGANACGKLSIRGSASLMTQCVLYLGNDTGTMHLAVAAGIPCVAVFSARDVPGKWYPYGKGHRVHRIAVDCEGCMLTECIQQKKRCLTGISADNVIESCREILVRSFR